MTDHQRRVQIDHQPRQLAACRPCQRERVAVGLGVLGPRDLPGRGAGPGDPRQRLGVDAVEQPPARRVRRHRPEQRRLGGEVCPAQEDELLTKHIEKIHEESRGTYGWPRVHAELTLGLGPAVNHKRVARLMREAGIQGLYRRRRHGCTVRDPEADPYPDLVERRFSVEAPDQLWMTDITEHGTEEGKLYCAAVLDAYSRRIIGWSIDANMRTALVTDALGMAITGRQPENGSTIMHSDHGSQFTSWAFGQRLHAAGLLGSMGSIGDCYATR